MKSRKKKGSASRTPAASRRTAGRRFTAGQQAAFRRWLEDRAETLRAELGVDLHEDLNAEPELAAARRDADELADIDAALERLGTASYGVCASCGVDIPLVRLRANPAAALCLACQTRNEKKRPRATR
jgi:RNA polymerase-binding transcription factor DksA